MALNLKASRPAFTGGFCSKLVFTSPVALEVSRVMHYDYEFHRQRQHERMAEIRAEYQRAQVTSNSRAAS